MFWSISLISLALSLYTTAIWSERIKHRLRPWMLFIFILAFICDILGTSLMAKNHPQAHLNLHTICGLLALIIMLVHLLWAVDALARQGRCLLLFHRFSIWAWALWLIAFVSGIPRNI